MTSLSCTFLRTKEKKTVVGNNSKGIEIRLIEFKKNSSFYESKEGCINCFNDKINNLSRTPFIDDIDIDSLNFENQFFKLKEKSFFKLKEKFKTKNKIPASLYLNENKLYDFWFWKSDLSSITNEVFVYSNVGNRFIFQFNYSQKNISSKEDPRFKVDWSKKK